MELQKLLINAAATGLLAGASATAMAVDCATGNLIGQTVEEVVINGQSCYMEDLIVSGDVIVIDSEDLTMVQVNAGGRIRVLGGGNALLVANTARGIVVRNSEYVNLVTNIISGWTHSRMKPQRTDAELLAGALMTVVALTCDRQPGQCSEGF